MRHCCFNVYRTNQKEYETYLIKLKFKTQFKYLLCVFAALISTVLASPPTGNTLHRRLYGKSAVEVAKACATGDDKACADIKAGKYKVDEKVLEKVITFTMKDFNKVQKECFKKSSDEKACDQWMDMKSAAMRLNNAVGLVQGAPYTDLKFHYQLFNYILILLNKNLIYNIFLI